MAYSDFRDVKKNRQVNFKNQWNIIKCKLSFHRYPRTTHTPLNNWTVSP